ncbi:MAG: glycosyltransferase family 39 protein [Propionibacteriaceae bacterium]
MTSLIQHPLTEAPASTALVLEAGPEARRARSAPGHRLRRWLSSSLLWLALIAVLQIVLSRLVPRNATAFQDEGLYIYMGHRVLDQLSGGERLFEWPGSYFSGAPGFYPVLAALVDSIGGLQAARDLSLAFIVVAMVGVFGIGKQLFGRAAGLLGALVFAICGPVIYVSQWATFDSLTLMLAALAGWLAVYSARRDGFLQAPVVALILTVAVFAKYAGAMYVPVIAALAVAVGWSRFGWVIVRRAAFMVAATVTLFFFVVMLWGRGMLAGLAQTTTERQILNPTSAAELTVKVGLWIGPWLALALIGGALRIRRQPLLVLVLLGGAVLGPVHQIHLGESTSLSKHVAFGIIFAAPLIGDLFARMVNLRVGLVAVVLLVLGALGLHGFHYAGNFRTAYPDDTHFQVYLREAVAANPGLPILAEQSSAQRYELRDVMEPRQWIDTYVFNYDGATGPEAYKRAIQDHYFGVIYLNFTTANSHEIIKSLGAGQGEDRYYHLVGQVPGYIHGKQVGYWLMWTPQTHKFTPIR